MTNNPLNKTAWIGSEVLSEMHETLYYDVNAPYTECIFEFVQTLMALASTGVIKITLTDENKNRNNPHTINPTAVKWVCAEDCEGDCNRECDGYLDYDQDEHDEIYCRILEEKASLYAEIVDREQSRRNKKRAKGRR